MTGKTQLIENQNYLSAANESNKANLGIKRYEQALKSVQYMYALVKTYTQMMLLNSNTNWTEGKYLINIALEKYFKEFSHGIF